jgi:hypothetical protein
MEIDYDSPAELFIPKRGGRERRQTINYRRFATAAEAIRFAVEEFPAVRTLGAWMQVGDYRYDSQEICRLYESNGYPLRRAPSWLSPSITRSGSEICSVDKSSPWSPGKNALTTSIIKERRRLISRCRSFAKITSARTSYRFFANGATARGKAWPRTDA